MLTNLAIFVPPVRGQESIGIESRDVLDIMAVQQQQQRVSDLLSALCESYTRGKGTSCITVAFNLGILT